MPGEHNFEYLPLVRTFKGPAKLRGGGKAAPQTIANRNARQAHSLALDTAAQAFSANWQARKAERQAVGEPLPEIPSGVPILLQVDPGLDLDALREKFAFEIVAEQEEGYVIVASEDIQIAPFRAMLQGFAVTVHGSATIAKVHKLFADPTQTDRLSRILSEHLMSMWGNLGDDQLYIVDIGIACAGTQEIPTKPKRGKRATDADWAAKEFAWSEARASAYNEWDDIKIERETAIQKFAEFYEADILHLVDGSDFDAGVLADSFTVRLKISGKGLRDFVLNYPYVFEVVEPEDIALPQNAGQPGAEPVLAVAPIAPDADAPAVCVMDSGVQEGHLLLQPAIDAAASHCFLPDKASTDVGDFVAGGGHGTRVAGAVIYGEEVAKAGTPKLPFWIQNARVLDENNRMPDEVFPAEAMRTAVERYHFGPRITRIFNHSINAYGYCRLRYMSSWAAEIDALSNEHDVLVIQSAGNIRPTGPMPYPGVKDHLDAGRTYPEFLYEPAARVANPGQSLQALTVGSIAYDAFETGNWRSFATGPDLPSAFSRSGPGIWNVIKPEVVEYGGDFIRTNNQPVDVQGGGGIPAACPELVRSTMFPPGPASDRDATGTSFATPKVARIAARLQRLLPAEPTLLYRALLVQSAQWPTWAEGVLSQLREPNGQQNQATRQQLLDDASQIIRCIGFGVPDETRATVNTDLVGQLQSIQAVAAKAPAQATADIAAKAEAAAAEINIDEAATRVLIDEQLRARGWEVDTQKLRFSAGSRPAKGRSMAIAEWPTASGPADYALFAGTKCIGVVEAKRRNKNVSAHIDQTHRYARGFKFEGGAEAIAGPWPAGEEAFLVPYVFSANGRPYLKQLETESGIWFRDTRRAANHRRALVDWPTPDGLAGLLEIDVDSATADLKATGFDFGFPLRPYPTSSISSRSGAA